jgi:hypothetical protein
MVTQFLTLETDTTNLSSPLRHTVEAQLKRQGEPLRWAITAASAANVRVEAVILQGEETVFPCSAAAKPCP